MTTYVRIITGIFYLLEIWDSNPYYLVPKTNALPIKLISI